MHFVSSWQIRILIVTSIVGIVIFGYFSTGLLDIQPLHYIGLITTLISLGVFVWNKWIWKINLIQKIPFVPPNINGTWEGTIEYQDDNKQTIVEKAYLVIEQNNRNLFRVDLLSKESQSALSSPAYLVKENSKQYFEYFYRNSTKESVKHRSANHIGSAHIQYNAISTSLSGEYWTDRKSKGELTFKARKNKLANTYLDASSLFNQ
jgi:hypothetical protein